MSMHRVSRRNVLGGTAAGFAALPLAARAAVSEQDAPPAVVVETAPVRTPETQDIVLQVNGRRLALSVEPRTSLLDTLREQAGLTGTKKGCDRGSCGACTVHLDGRRVVSCLTLAVRCQGRAIATVEGLASDGDLHPVQAAFLDHDALQCGYCTPGQIMSAAALIEEGHAGSADEIREWMSGNLCRCGAYPNIVAAIQTAARSTTSEG